MASTFVDAGGEGKEQQQHHHHHSPECHHQQPGAPSPRTSRRTRSSVSSTVAKVTPAAAPKCVCAPTTHAGSFKCRLHRVSSRPLHGIVHRLQITSRPRLMTKLAVSTAELYCPSSTPAMLRTYLKSDNISLKKFSS
ncbi:hypothetical protein MUK42_03496 [Musa troglodytarum]|uniref:Uncharacterized protein n=1 Tax=Musa troglodytarum TaxID=320322 RepID=A0A9E7GXA9_9LILI|nr:hypothetical protein MUK42_03496 [Musa troglodytarum]